MRYEIRAAALTCHISHCHLCQKRTGSAFSLSLVLPADGEKSRIAVRETPRRSRPALSSSTASDAGGSKGRACSSDWRRTPSVAMKPAQQGRGQPVGEAAARADLERV
jgi:hypothetical protein